MRILHITNAFPYSGYKSYGIFIKEQIESLQDIGLENEIIFINSRMNGFFQYFKEIRNVFSTCHSFKPNIIHCHHEFSLLACIPFILFNSTPVVLSLLGDISKRSVLNKIFFEIVKKIPSAIIYKSANLSTASNYHYLPNGVNTELFFPLSKLESKTKLKLDINKKYILFVCASLGNPIKRYDKFSKIVAELKKIDNSVEELILSGVDRVDVPLYFNSAHFLLLTSDHEGSPNAIKEAMCCNIPIVSTDVGNVASLFNDSKGLYVNGVDDYNGLLQSCKDALSLFESNGREVIFNLGLDMGTVAHLLKNIYIKIVS